jgi:CheY-like chemotaxis protein
MNMLLHLGTHGLPARSARDVQPAAVAADRRTARRRNLGDGDAPVAETGQWTFACADASRPGGMSSRQPATTEPGVLLVDDDAGVRTVLAEIISADRRFQVVGEARDGREGLEVAARLRPDIVLLDQQMPGMTGLEALPGLRDCVPDAVLVMFAGFGDAEIERRALAAGAHAFAEKGTRMSALLDRMAELLPGPPDAR